MTKSMKLPGPDHPITIEPARGRVVVTADGRPLADSRHALILKEAGYPPVYYLPRQDTAMQRLQQSARRTYCPYKGDCSYLSIIDAGAKGADAVWSYEAPYPSVEAIAGHLAFYPDRVDRIALENDDASSIS